MVVNGALMWASNRYMVEHQGDPPEADVAGTILRALYAPLGPIFTYIMHNGEPNYPLYFVLLFLYTGILGSAMGTLVVLAVAWIKARTKPVPPKTGP